MLSIIILIGLNTLMITNTMSYHVDLFLGTVLLMDMVFAFLILLYYFPFSSKPEHLYPLMVKRFTVLNSLQFRSSKLMKWYASSHLTPTFEKLKLWCKIDHSYFNLVDKEKIEALQFSITELIKELNHCPPSGYEQQKIRDIFRSWHTYIDTPSTVLASQYFYFYPPLRLRLIECQKSIEAIDWNHLKQGRF